MMILADNAIRLEPADGGDAATSELILNGRRTGRMVPGIRLEAAVETPYGYLLFTTDDSPFEEILGLHLVGRDGGLKDSAFVGVAYATGIFSDLRVGGKDCLTFLFIGDRKWIVRVLPRRELRMPFVPDTIGVWRRFGLTRRMRISSIPVAR